MGGYIEGSLLKNERIVFVAKPHWVVFVPSFVMVVLTFLLWEFGSIFFSGGFSLRLPFLRGMPFSTIVALCAVAITLYSLFKAMVMYNSSEYGITDRRIIMKRGFIQRDILELFVRRLEAVNVNQTVFGRLMGYGTLVVIGTGGTRDFFTDIPDPIGFRRMIQQQMDLIIDGDDQDMSPTSKRGPRTRG